MTDKNDGGPAFPYATQYWGTGMTLRDWFAGQALAGDAANNDNGSFSLSAIVDALAANASLYYRIADAMLAARNK